MRIIFHQSFRRNHIISCFIIFGTQLAIKLRPPINTHQCQLSPVIGNDLLSPSTTPPTQANNNNNSNVSPQIITKSLSILVIGDLTWPTKTTTKLPSTLLTSPYSSASLQRSFQHTEFPHSLKLCPPSTIDQGHCTPSASASPSPVHTWDQRAASMPPSI